MKNKFEKVRRDKFNKFNLVSDIDMFQFQYGMKSYPRDELIGKDPVYFRLPMINATKYAILRQYLENETVRYGNLISISYKTTASEIHFIVRREWAPFVDKFIPDCRIEF